MTKRKSKKNEFANMTAEELEADLSGIERTIRNAQLMAWDRMFEYQPTKFADAMHALEWGEGHAQMLREIVAWYDPLDSHECVLEGVKKELSPENELALYIAIRCLRQEFGHDPNVNDGYPH